MNTTRTEPSRSNLTLWLILATCVLPFVAATALFYLAPPDRQMNHGELLPPRPLPPWMLQDLEGKPANADSVRGRWTLAMVDSGECTQACRDKLYKMRQVRLAQGKHMDRVQRLWLLTDRQLPDAQLLQEYRGTLVLRAAGVALGEGLPATGSLQEPIWIIDPLGNVMMRYPAGADPTGIKKDLERLLRVSRIE